MIRPYAEVIGDPIAHSKSPLIHNFWLEKLGIDAEYRKTHVRPDELADYFTQRRGDAEWRGCSVTIPHKQAVQTHLNGLDPAAQSIGAVNCIVADATGLNGYNTDVAGITEPLRAAGFSGKSAVLIGAGGAALAALAAFRDLRITHVTVANRSLDKARAIHPQVVGIDELRPSADLLFNATSLGMIGQPPLDLDLTAMPDTGIVFDAVYAPLETPLLATARARGLRTIDGLQMLVGQAAAAFELFFGQPAPRQHDAELRALLTA